MWQSLVKKWKSIWGQTSDPIPPELLASLQDLVNDELNTRKRKGKADRFQRAGATAIAALVGSYAILALISADVAPEPSGAATAGDSLLLLYVTIAVVVWNVLGWWGTRQAVHFTSLYWVLGVAVLFCVVAIDTGFRLLVAWSTGHNVLTTWTTDVEWGGLASSLLPLLAALGIAIGTGFLADKYNEATSPKGMAWWFKAAIYTYVIFGLVGLISSLYVIGNLTSGRLPGPQLTTFALAAPYVSSWLSVLAWAPIAVVAYRRQKAPKTGGDPKQGQVQSPGA